MKVVDLLCFRRHVKRRRRRRLWNVWTCLQVPRRQRTMTHKKLSFTALEQSSIWRFRRAGRSDAMAPTPPLPVTEDTPPDMLAGSMDLRVVLPSGQSVKMSVERSTPMMDLLVQVTTVNKISTGGHVLQAIGERGILPYKPSTPIGALDAWTIQVVAKSKVQTNTVQKKAPLKPLNQQQPFEQTFRLQVHLPRNQLYVMRVSPRTLLSDILNQTCAEKNLDPNKYEMRHPANLSQLLSPSCTLADYRLQEVTVVARSRAPGLGSALSSSDIMALQREEDKRRQQARQQHGTGTGLGLVFNKRSQSSVCEGSVSSDSLGGRSISPARSDESASRSASPPAPNLPPMIAPLPPARPARKRRPAPKPPSLTNGPSNNKQQSESNMQAESSTGTVVNGHSENNSKTTNVPVSHSRNSSDSSGYHEASVLSESPADGHQMSDNCSADTLPRRGKLTSGQPTRNKTQNNNHGLSRSMSSLTGVGGSMASCQHSTSNTSLASSTGQGQKKKKAPPPPPGAAAAAATKDRQQQNNMSSLSLSSTEQDVVEHHNKTTSLERHLSGKTSTTVSNQLPDKCSTLPGKMKMSGHDYKSSSSQEDEDYRIPEVEENSSLTNMHKEPSSLSKQTKEEVHNGPSPEIAIEKQDTPSQELAMSPVETTPEAPVELVPSPKAAAKSIPEDLQQELTIHAPTPKPRTRHRLNQCDESRSGGVEGDSLPRLKPVPPPRQVSSNSIQSSGAGSVKKRDGDSVGGTFGVGSTILMLSQSGTESVSSDSWEWRSRSSAVDSDDDLNIADNEMEMFDMGSEESDIQQAQNNVMCNISTVNKRLLDSYDDFESVSVASSVFEYDSEHESSEASSTLRRPPPENMLKIKGKRGLGPCRGGSLRVADKNAVQKKFPPISRGSSTSLQSMDEVPAFLESGSNNNSMGRWTNMESLIMETPASKQSWVLGYDSETEEIGIAEAVDQVEEAFRSVTAELEAASEQDEDVNVLIPPPVTAIDEVEKLNSLPSEDLNILPPPPLSATKQDENIEAIPPPPSSAEDMAVDWEYQLPAPPSAFRDSNSPTFTEGGTVMLADTQVFQEPSLSPEPQPQNDPMVMHLSRAVHRNEVTRTNPLFDPRQCEEDPKQSTGVCEVGMEEFSNETKSLESRDTSNRKGGDLANFTITAYQRPRETDEIFNEDSDDDRTRSALNSVKKPITTQTHRYGSSNSLNNNAVHNTAANLSRTNSFNNNNNITFKPPAPVATSVKRSTSYISLIANTTSQPGKSLQSGPVYTSRTKSVGNLAVEEQGDRNVERTHENWGLRKTSSEFNVSQDTPAERQEEFETPQTKAEEPRGSQQGIVITAEERARLLALQEQFLQLQEQLLQNSSLLQQQQQQPHASQTPNADTPLQSLQVLRSILPQLHQTKAPSQQQSSESSVPLRSDTLPAKASKHSENSSGDQLIKQTTVVTLNQQNNNEKPSNDESTGEQKRYKYQGPPAINFATWSERPKSQVSIKMDGDYRIGIGQGGRTDEHNETPARTGMSETKDRTSAAGRKQDIEVSSKSNNSHEEATDQNKFQVSGGKLNSTEPITKVEPASLTMRLISHTTASGFRKPIGVANQKFGSSNYVTAETQHSETKEVAGSSTVGVRVGSTSQHNDPSRVPIVRAVELKKSFIQQQSMYNNSNSNSNNNNSNSHNFRGSSTMLNGERSGGSSVAESDGDNTVETFVGVNSLTKRFSVVSSSSNNAPNFRSSRPVSAYGKVENLEVRGRDAASSLPYNNSLSYRSTSSTNLNTTTNVNTYQDVPLKNGGGRSTRRYTSVVGITNDSDHNLSSSSFREPASESSRVQSRVSGSSVVRVNGFTAPKQLMPVVKGFQFACPAANRDPSPPPSKTSNTTNNFHPKVHRSESTSAVRSWKTVDTTDQSSTSFNNVKAYLRRNSNEPKPEPIATKTATPNTESQPPAPPPLAASLRKSTARPRPKTLPAPQLNPRDQLMDAIRNFGGRENLKQNGRS
ncbi:serine-rich adhesin for platelets-like isoform X2 [Periplaneta americana]|uniref:serine-rich adhesin for platelets-like isoform X2 n=1 Tax=Periplaneta americana TaxID=6978 RepID=UPI0037E75820